MFATISEKLFLQSFVNRQNLSRPSRCTAGSAPSDRPSSSVANYVDLVANEVPSGDLFPKKWVEIVKPLKLSATIAGCVPPTNRLHREGRFQHHRRDDHFLKSPTLQSDRFAKRGLVGQLALAVNPIVEFGLLKDTIEANASFVCNGNIQ